MRRKFSENIYVEIQRVKQNGPRKPLRTFNEMAEEFGVSSPVLRQALSRDGAPKPEIRHKSNYSETTNSWYEPVAMRKWWKGLKS